MIVYLGKYLAAVETSSVRVDGINDKGKWKNSKGDDLDYPFPEKLGFTKDKGDGSTLKWNVGKGRLEGGAPADKKVSFLCVEVCEEATTTRATLSPTSTVQSDKCGEGWIELEDQTCVMQAKEKKLSNFG